MLHTISTIQVKLYSFSFAMVFSHWVFPSKVLTRQLMLICGHPRGSVENIGMLNAHSHTHIFNIHENETDSGNKQFSMPMQMMWTLDL